MSRSPQGLFVLVVAVVALSGCERLEEQGEQQPPLSFRETAAAVPLAYGRLVAVTPVGRHANTVEVWYEAEDQTLRGVRVNVSTGAISKRALVVPRE
jgi:hypothetical protein